MTLHKLDTLKTEKENKMIRDMLEQVLITIT